MNVRLVLRDFGTSLLLVAAALLGACGDDDSASARRQDTGDAQELRASLPRDPIQDEILADGEVTDAELEAAILAVVACVRNAGVEAETEFVPGKLPAIIVGTENAGDESADAAAAVLDDCSQSIINDVQVAYTEARQPSEEELQVINELIVECLGEAGYEVSGLTPEAVMDAADPFDLAQCIDQSQP